MDYRKLTKIVDGSVNRYKFIDAKEYTYEDFLDYLSGCDESERFLVYLNEDDDLVRRSVRESDLSSVYYSRGKWMSYNVVDDCDCQVKDWPLRKYDTVYVWEDTYNV